MLLVLGGAILGGGERGVVHHLVLKLADRVVIQEALKIPHERHEEHHEKGPQVGEIKRLYVRPQHTKPLHP